MTGIGLKALLTHAWLEFSWIVTRKIAHVSKTACSRKKIVLSGIYLEKYLNLTFVKIAISHQRK